MEIVSTRSSTNVALWSYLKRSVVMSWIVAVAGKEAYPVALARRSSCHHQPAFVRGSLHQRFAPPGAAVIGVCRRQQCAPPVWRSSNRVSDLEACCPSASAASKSLADTAWRTSGGSPFARGRYRHRCVSHPAQHGLRKFSGSARVLGGITSSNSSGGGDKEETRNSLPVEDVANTEGSPSEEAVQDATRQKKGSKCAFDDAGNSSAPGSDVEPLVEQVASALKQRCSVRGGDLVLVLVSGGSDSVALLLALDEAAKKFQPALRVEAAHFNHALRGKDSDADQEFVTGLAHGLGVPLHVRRWKGADEGGTGGPGAGMQERARRWRRSEATDIMSRGLGQAEVGQGDGKTGFIATAHHKDDQVETVLLKALRGAHITNMQGMAWYSPPFIRPLLEARKSDLVEFLNGRRQAWREDGSNQVAKYARNRVRLQLVPLLQELAGGTRALEVRLEELSRQSLFAKEMLEREAVRWERQNLGLPRRSDTRSMSTTDWSEEADGTVVLQGRGEVTGEGTRALLGVRREEFPLLPFLKMGRGSGSAGEEASGRGGAGADLPDLVREELLHRFVMANTGDAPLPYAHLVLLMRQVDEGGRKWSLSLGGGHHLLRVGDFLRIEHHPEGDRKTSVPFEVSGTCADSEEEKSGLGGGSEAQRAAGAAVAAVPWRIVVDPCGDGGVESSEQCMETEDLGDGEEMEREEGMVLFNVPPGVQLKVRRKRDGDRFQPAWRDRPAKLKDFLRGQGVPLHRRDEVALICDQHDTEVIAVYPSYPGLEYCQDSTGARPIRVRINGAPLFCPRPEDRGGVPT